MLPSGPCSAPPPLKISRSPAQFHHRRCVSANCVFIVSNSSLKRRKFGCRLVAISWEEENSDAVTTSNPTSRLCLSYLFNRSCVPQAQPLSEGNAKANVNKLSNLTFTDSLLDEHLWISKPFFFLHLPDAGLCPGHAGGTGPAWVRPGPAASKTSRKSTTYAKKRKGPFPFLVAAVSSLLLYFLPPLDDPWASGLWGGICGGLLWSGFCFDSNIFISPSSNVIFTFQREVNVPVHPRGHKNRPKLKGFFFFLIWGDSEE